MIAVRPSSLISLQLAALASAALVLLPLIYIVSLALSADPSVWYRLWATRVPELLWNTISLAGAVVLLALALGVSTSWIVTRCEFPGRRFWEVALVFPLAMPTFVLAYVFNYLLGFGGPVEQLWQMLAGNPQARIFSPQSFMGVTLVMGLATFPFIYLLTRSALLNFNVSFEEVARTCGASPLRRIFSVTLPLLRPSIVAGVALVILYVVSDFGAVSLLRYQTLTYAVFQQMTGQLDNQAASILSVLLVVLALLFLVTERWFRRKSRFYQTAGRYRAPQRIQCNRLQTVGLTASLSVILGAAFGIPVCFLIAWSLSPEALAILDAQFFGFVWNSAVLATLAATAGVLVGLPLAYLASRKPTWLNTGCLQAAYAGYVLPGPVAALAVLVLCLNLIPVVYGTVIVLIIAYVLHFLPAGLQSLEPAIQQITPNLEEVARTLGLNARETVRQVTLPLIRNGIIVAWVLIFLQTMKELPATLLLRPVGFDTLAIRVWLEASEEYYQLAAPSALLIVLVGLPALGLLLSRDWRTA
ncbi:putative ABC-type Fe3+ transport system, permease component [Candidatus Nitrospira nitrosa]|uniref:Putative ABC-type Fe3+ transport system, permease component n=1 Tax=Candidatus Nitrospira nitrosa TaxID=1742972 RepID=A0A0S4L1B7_9BACT|nr:iron ABC transporter permease [Candidatus Nitrospira nitrosa]CUS31319.1 putative ABC-type Fe3+ transport system, permease component [Candidatus Nitrospira nitrosa]